jgi:ParB family chromosome partitioning protein
MTLQTAKLSQLRLAPENVRKVKPAQIDQLAADLLAHGQIQNVVGYAEGKYLYVSAGGRRYRAFKRLEKAKAIPPSHPVSIDVRDKAEAVELSLAENVQREAMHVADAVVAYGALRDQGLSPEDVAARFGVALSYVTKVLRLSALAPVALALLAKDKIGMEAAQALTLTDDHDKQDEALNRCGNSGHAIRRMLTETKIGTGQALFRFIGGDAYAAAGGTITRDLFAGEGDGYADDPALVETLATAKLDAIADGYRAQGWQDVRASLERPDDYYNVVAIHASGSREPSEDEAAEGARIEAAITARKAELGDDARWNDAIVEGLRAEAQALDDRRHLFDDAQKAEGAMVLFVGRAGVIEAKAIRTKRAPRGGSAGAAVEKPDYSGATVEALSKIKTLAVQEAVANDPALALDILLDCLAGQIVHGEPSYQSPLALRLDGFNAVPPEDLMDASGIRNVEQIGAEDFAALPEVGRFAAIRAMDAEAKGRLLARLVAGQINGVQASGMRRDTRHGRFDRIAFAAKPDMASKWRAPTAFFARLRKPIILKAMADALGQPAADNCAKMKKGELAVAAAERLADKGWLPPALAIAEPEAEVACAPSFDNEDDGDGFGEEEGFDEEEAA